MIILKEEINKTLVLETKIGNIKKCLIQFRLKMI